MNQPIPYHIVSLSCRVSGDAAVLCCAVVMNFLGSGMDWSGVEGFLRPLCKGGIGNSIKAPYPVRAAAPRGG